MGGVWVWYWGGVLTGGWGVGVVLGRGTDGGLVWSWGKSMTSLVIKVGSMVVHNNPFYPDIAHEIMY